MIFTGKDKQQIDSLRKHIELLGGSLIKECTGGSIYYSLGHIDQIRISDHFGLKFGPFQIDIILKDNKYLCIYNRDFLTYDKISDVKQWISHMNFSINLFYIYLENSYDSEISNLKKSLNKKQNDIEHLEKTNKELSKQLKETTDKIIKRDKQIEDKKNQLKKASEYHNKCQELESQLKKQQEKLNRLWIMEAHMNE